MNNTIVQLLQRLKLNDAITAAKIVINRLRPCNIRRIRQMSKFYAQFIEKGDLCFDVGANLGNRTEIFLKLGAKVVAIEPQHDLMQSLSRKYRKNDRVILIQKALGEKEGRGRLMLTDLHCLASMSEEWIKSIQTSGRFPDNSWDNCVSVPITTLDKLINEFGQPVFCKIDVEGAELSVLRGLSRPIKFISFEFAYEFLHQTIDSIMYLENMKATFVGSNELILFNYSIAESMSLTLPKWVEAGEMCQVLMSLKDKTIWGDVYAKLVKEINSNS